MFGILPGLLASLAASDPVQPDLSLAANLHRPVPSNTAVLSAFQVEDEPRQPWRVQSAWGLPEWLTLSGTSRWRYESLSDAIRVLQDGSNQLYAFKTMIAARAQLDETFNITGELIDSRAMDFPADAILGTGTVNAVELLQGYVGVNLNEVVREGDEVEVQIGRHTMDVGSRRLVARNRFRNTVNAFTGVNVQWQDESSDHHVRAFAVVPVRRLPRDQPSLRDNDIEFDEEQEDTRFFGLFGDFPLHDKVRAEAYAFHLDENDETDVPTRNRNITTIGARIHKKAATNQVHFEWESAFQFGESRATPLATDTTDLDHAAQFHHLIVGYRFEGEAKPELELLLDYASGDDDTTDGDNNRFDTLFGARRFEFGPTGIFGAFARSNLFSPGLRSKFRPTPKTRVMIASRMHYLASERDVWTTTGLFDASGAAGNYLGNLTEFRVRQDLVKDNVMLEFGYAHLFAGSFVDDAPNATGQGDTDYGYVALTFTF